MLWGGIMGSLDEQPLRSTLISKVLKISLPRTGPLMKDDINTVLNDGWHIAASYYDTSRDEVRFIFTRPKRQAG